MPIEAPRRLLVCLPKDTPWIDPDPGVTAGRGIVVVHDVRDRPTAVLGWSDGGASAIALTARSGEAVDRLVLVSVPAPFDGQPPVDVGGVTAKTLLLFGSDDERTGSRHGRWWQTHLPDARLEMVPSGRHDLVGPMWGRITSFVAPGRMGRVRNDIG
jgi:pimeloyl-ACP methyl ester carboxylesterase